jgi:hypothetical protein
MRKLSLMILEILTLHKSQSKQLSGKILVARYLITVMTYNDSEQALTAHSEATQGRKLAHFRASLWQQADQVLQQPLFAAEFAMTA